MVDFKLVPTLFEIKEFEDKTDTLITTEIKAIFDDNIMRQLLNKNEEEKVLGIGSIFNVLLKKPNASNISKAVTYKYKVLDEENEDSKTYNLPEIEMNNRVLYMKLLEIGEAASNYKEQSFAEVDLLPKKDRKKTNKGTFKCQKKYYMGEWESKEKYLFVEDQERNLKLAFRCWIDEMPIPGQTEGVYIYVDGSSQKTNNKVEKYGAGYVINYGNTVYIGRKVGVDEGANVTGEYVAATNAFNDIIKISEEKGEIDNLRIFYDNNNLGYVPTGIFKPNTFGKDYKEAIQSFQKKHPETTIEFMHVDAHSAAYGSEMVDQVADVVGDHKEEGDYSKRLKYIGRENNTHDK